MELNIFPIKGIQNIVIENDSSWCEITYLWTMSTWQFIHQGTIHTNCKFSPFSILNPHWSHPLFTSGWTVSCWTTVNKTLNLFVLEMEEQLALEQLLAISLLATDTSSANNPLVLKKLLSTGFILFPPCDAIHSQCPNIYLHSNQNSMDFLPIYADIHCSNVYSAILYKGSLVLWKLLSLSNSMAIYLCCFHFKEAQIQLS